MDTDKAAARKNWDVQQNYQCRGYFSDPMKTYSAFMFLLASLFAAPAQGMFRKPNFIPVERMLNSAQKYLMTHPASAEAHYTLARIHYLAFINSNSLILGFSGESPDDSNDPDEFFTPLVVRNPACIFPVMSGRANWPELSWPAATHGLSMKTQWFFGRRLHHIWWSWREQRRRVRARGGAIV